MRAKRAASRPDPLPNPAPVTRVIKLVAVFADLTYISHGTQNCRNTTYVLHQIRTEQAKNHRSTDSDDRSVRRAGDRVLDLLE